VAAGWGGVPVVWSGDELAQPNDPGWAEEPGHEDDNRWAHRPRLDWMRAKARHNPDTVPGQVFGGLARIARVRASLPQLHASAPSHVVPDTDEGVLATVRRHPAGVFVGLYNVTPEVRGLPLARLHDLGVVRPYDALGGHRLEVAADGVLRLPPYAAWWVVEAPSPP
jgi:amylosucrase